MTSFARALARDPLQRAWEDVWANDQEDGVLQPSIKRFSGEASDRLDALAAALADGSYEPGVLTEVGLPKPDGGTRTLHVPTVVDRVVERAVLRAVVGSVDPLLSPAAFAYRPGLGVRHAVQRVVQLRDEGFAWAVRTDVHDCFPTVDVARTLRLFSLVVPDEALISLTERLLARPVLALDGRRSFPGGLPQGGPLSPLLANLALDGLDATLIDAGFPVVRYADDLVIHCRSETAGLHALEVARTWVEGVGMSLGEDKTEVMSFERGFCFLGEDFGPRYPPSLPEAPDQPDRQVLYVARQGARVRLGGGRVLVESADKAGLLSVPETTVDRVVCFGSVGFSAGAREWALGSQVPVIFLSRKGSYQGQLLGADGRKRTSRLRAQLSLTPERSMALARVMLRGKLTKQGVLLRHFTRDDNADRVAPATSEIGSYCAMLDAAISPDELMGLEGAAARSYFGAWEALLPPELAFTGRNRQPPLDVVNAALGYAYAVLLGECTAALATAGLEPAVGCLHTDSRGQPALALDLMEEFRPTIVDQVVVQLARAKALRPEHGAATPGKPGVLLTKAGKAAVMDGYERRMVTSVKALPEFAGSWRRHLYRQAQRLAAAIAGNLDAYTGLSWR